MARLDSETLPVHVAIIPDGNGRWAEARGLSRDAGHQRGTDVVRQIVRGAHELGIRILTMYAFSTENWTRPEEEVEAIMDLFSVYLRSEAEELHRNGVRVHAFGRLERLSPTLQRDIREIVELTRENDEMRVNFALSYGGRGEITDAVRRVAAEVESGRLAPEAIDEKLVASYLYAPDLPDPDLLIRAGHEHRISNFLLWQVAYTELYMTDTLWPDFTKDDLTDAIASFQNRERRHGRTGAQVRRDP